MAYGMNINFWPRTVYVVRMEHNGDYVQTFYGVPWSPWSSPFYGSRLRDATADYRISSGI